MITTAAVTEVMSRDITLMTMGWDMTLMTTGGEVALTECGFVDKMVSVHDLRCSNFTCLYDEKLVYSPPFLDARVLSPLLRSFLVLHHSREWKFARENALY